MVLVPRQPLVIASNIQPWLPHEASELYAEGRFCSHGLLHRISTGCMSWILWQSLEECCTPGGGGGGGGGRGDGGGGGPCCKESHWSLRKVTAVALPGGLRGPRGPRRLGTAREFLLRRTRLAQYSFLYIHMLPCKVILNGVMAFSGYPGPGPLQKNLSASYHPYSQALTCRNVKPSDLPLSQCGQPSGSWTSATPPCLSPARWFPHFALPKH